MKFKMMGLCLVALCFMGAVAATNAMAEAPEFVFEAGSKAFSSRNVTGNVGVLETSKGEEVKCKVEENTGEIEGASPSKKARDILIIYKECTAKILTKEYKCQNRATLGEIVSFDLLARLGWINKVKLEVGILFNPEEGKAENPNNLFAEFECTRTGETIKIKVKGSIIARITPDEVLVGPLEAKKSFIVEFKKSAEGKGIPLWNKLEGETENHLLTETSISKAFIESSAEGNVEIFPLVSTKIIG